MGKKSKGNDNKSKRSENTEEFPSVMVDETASKKTDPDFHSEEVVNENQIEELKIEVTELKEEILRKQADYENFRKRMNRDKEDAIRFANTSLLLDLTTVIDDFSRAIMSAKDSNNSSSLQDGVELIEKQLLGMLERKWGLSRFNSVGELFDPMRHEVLSTEESEDCNESVVLEDYQQGFILHQRVVRPARVRIRKPVNDLDNGSTDVLGENKSSGDQGKGD